MELVWFLLLGLLLEFEIKGRKVSHAKVNILIAFLLLLLAF